MSVPTLVLCDDPWHPAEVVQHGFAALSHEGFSFEWLTDGAKWPACHRGNFPLIVIAKANHRSPADKRPWLTPGTESALVDQVRAGGSLLAIHGGTAGYAGLPSLRRVLGGVFQRHPDQCPVTVEPKPDHPLTRGVSAFTLPDEHYVMALDDTQADVFLHSRSLHGTQPAGWIRLEGKGRVCVLTPGHNLEVWLQPEFQKLLRNALNWTARLM